MTEQQKGKNGKKSHPRREAFTRWMHSSAFKCFLMDCGADLMAGSLIKNVGGGLAPTGGYIVGKKNWFIMPKCKVIQKIIL